MIDWCFKGFPPSLYGLSAEEAGEKGLSLLDGAFLMPVAILKDEAIRRNIRWMRAFLDMAGIDICPHGKTTMSPELFAQQKAAGIWGMTAATAHHVRVYRKWNVDRILLANQLVAPADIALVLDELEADPHFELFCLVDSLEGIDRLAAAIRARRLSRPLNVLVEVGAVGGRTGARTELEGVALAEAVARHGDALALRGIELFEGIYASDGDGPDEARKMLQALLSLARQVHAVGLFAPGDILLTGGGSSLFDICAAMLVHADLDGRQKVILRSGCYITHDHGTYARAIEAIRQRNPDFCQLDVGPSPALEIWAVVQSVPEPGYAIATLGKRDVGFDADLPVPIWHYRPGPQKRPQPPGEMLRVTKLYDQHACLEGAHGLAVGDLLGFGISHPCTTFDKWRAMPVVDDDYRMKSYVTTAF